MVNEESSDRERPQCSAGFSRLRFLVFEPQSETETDLPNPELSQQGLSYFQ